MKRAGLSTVLALFTGAAGVVRAITTVYVTELPAFTSLASCAQYAVSYNIQYQTNSLCNEAPAALQSCVCTNNGMSASISTAISRSVAYECGTTATDDQSSAAAMFGAYCNQATPLTFPTPTVSVTQYITDFPAAQNLAPCALGALEDAVSSLTYSLCPEGAANVATCVCQKNQNSVRVSQLINSSARYSCSSHTADASSAQAMFAAYCGLLNGTTSFPTPTNPPGDMSYYVTALPQYNSLVRCAQEAVSYAVQSQSYALCPSGPQALASCVCIKDQMPAMMTSLITSGVKWSCANTATEDISSALSVYDFYCNAAKALAQPTGVSESVSQTYQTAQTGSAANGGGAKQTGSSGGSGGASNTSPGGSSPTGSGSGAGGNGTGGTTNPTSSGTNVGTIVGAVVGVIGGLCLIAGIAFAIWRHNHNKPGAGGAFPAVEAANAAGPSGNSPSDYNGKQELGGQPIVGVVGAPPPAASPSPSMVKPGTSPRPDTVSPVSAGAGTGAFSPPSNHAELGAVPPVPYHPELQGQNAYPSPSPHHPELQGSGANSPSVRPELQGQAPAPPTYHPELQGNSMPPHQGQYPQGQGYAQYPQQYQQQPPHPAELQAMSWQAGPVTGYHEMEGTGHAPGQAR